MSVPRISVRKFILRALSLLTRTFTSSTTEARPRNRWLKDNFGARLKNCEAKYVNDKLDGLEPSPSRRQFEPVPAHLARGRARASAGCAGLTFYTQRRLLNTILVLYLRRTRNFCFLHVYHSTSPVSFPLLFTSSFSSLHFLFLFSTLF